MAVKKSASTRVVSFVLAIAFGVIALTLTYSAALQSTEKRSRAAPPATTTYRNWEFNGSTLEGWTVNNFLNPRVGGGILQVSFGKPTLSTLMKTNENIALPEGGSIAVRMGTRQALMAPSRDDEPFEPTITGSVNVEFDKGKGLGKEFSVVADGVLREYKVALPSMRTNIKTITFSFSGLRQGTPVLFDWIRVAVKGTPPPLPTPTPTPTPMPVCQSGIATIGASVGNCPTGYTTKIVFTCYGGYSGSLGDGITCQMLKDLTKQAEEICRRYSTCPTPTPGDNK